MYAALNSVLLTILRYFISVLYNLVSSFLILAHSTYNGVKQNIPLPIKLSSFNINIYGDHLKLCQWNKDREQFLITMNSLNIRNIIISDL